MSARSCIFVLGFTLLSTLAPAQLPQAASARLDPTLLELPAIEEKDVILVYFGFVVNYNTERLISNWVAYELTAEELGGEVPRARGFSMDLAYSGRQAMTESFYLTNICPQDPTLNGRDWHALEAQIGYDLFANLEDSIEDIVESEAALDVW